MLIRIVANATLCLVLVAHFGAVQAQRSTPVTVVNTEANPVLTINADVRGEPWSWVAQLGHVSGEVGLFVVPEGCALTITKIVFGNGGFDGYLIIRRSVNVNETIWLDFRQNPYTQPVLDINPGVVMREGQVTRLITAAVEPILNILGRMKCAE